MSETMKIRITEPNSKYGHAISSKGHNYYNGDEVTVPKEVGERFCANGWAEDVAGVVATGERDLSPKKIQPEPAA